MTHGFDTSFLVAAEVACHPDHLKARALLGVLRASGEHFALAPQVLAEFVHVVTDARRFAAPLSIGAALDRAKAWWDSPEIEPVTPDWRTLNLFWEWMTTHHLGRKRVLDTMLAATYHSAGVTLVLTTNARDFTTFGQFTCITP